MSVYVIKTGQGFLEQNSFMGHKMGFTFFFSMILVVLSFIYFKTRKIWVLCFHLEASNKLYMYSFMQGIFLQVSSIPEENHIDRNRPAYILESMFTDCTLIHVMISTYPDMNKSSGISKEASGLCYLFQPEICTFWSTSVRLLSVICQCLPTHMVSPGYSNQSCWTWVFQGERKER